MSRKGKLPISLPKGVEIKISDAEVFVKGPKGTLLQPLVPGVQVKVEGDQIIVSLKDDNQDLNHFHGLYRTLIQNMVTGTTVGFEKKLEMIGVGYRAAVQEERSEEHTDFDYRL